MSNEDYQELNSYLNDLCLTLFDSAEIEDNFPKLINISSEFVQNYNNDTFQIVSKTNDLAADEVINMARQIIASIDIKCLTIFDKMLLKGQLDFDYDNKTSESCFRMLVHPLIKEQDTFHIKNDKVINIKREFNYDDVINLIHEFTHYNNASKKRDLSGGIINEFTAIYFELYASKFISKYYNPPDGELNYLNRLSSIYNISLTLKKYCDLIMMYKSFGNLNQNTYQDYNKYINNIYNDKNYKVLSNITLKGFKNTQFKDSFLKCYTYLSATFLALNASYTSNYKDVLKLSKEINYKFNQELTIKELLEKYNIHATNNFKENTLNGIDTYLSSFQDNIKRGK